MMIHAAAHTAVHAPALLSEVFTWFTRSAKLIAAGFIIFFMIWRKVARWWSIIILLALGIVVLPSTSPKVNEYTTDVTHGSAVGGTGASLGLLVLIGALVVLTIFMAARDSGGGGEE